jgi:hypothetical protein
MLVAFLILPYGCERDEEIAISTKAKFNAPSISQAKRHVEQHTSLKLRDPNNFFQSRDLEGDLTVDWELSGIKEYKDEPEQQVDILYTPIYINNDAEAKMFVGSVEYNGEIKSNIFCLIYTDLENTTTFSGYFLRFDLDGILLSASKYNNGMIVQPENDNSGTLGRSNNSDCTDFNTLLQCLQDYFGGDLDMSFWHLGGILDTVVVTATSIDAGDSTSGGSPLDTALPPSIYIPPADIDGNNTAGGIGLPFWSLNYVTANGFNISQWLEIHPLTPIAQWLMTEATTDQLQQIANFLNDHRFKIRDEYPLLNVDGSDGFEPANSPTASTGYAISEGASNFALNLIYYLFNNLDTDIEFIQYAIKIFTANQSSNPLLGADCRSFEFHQPPGALQRGCGVTNMNLTFYTLGIRPDGSPYYGEIDINTSLIYFTAPTWMTNSQAANVTASAVTNAIDLTRLYFYENPDISEQNLANFFNTNLVSQMAQIGGTASPIAPFPISNPAPFISNFFGAATDC